MSPGDIVKVHLQCQTEGQRHGFNRPQAKYHGPIHCLLTLIREEELLGLYKGALACRDGASLYDTLCSKLTKLGQKQQVSQMHEYDHFTVHSCFHAL